MGGMGSEDTNFHAEVYRRMGYAEVVDEVTALFRTGRKDEAAAIIPDAVVDDSAIVGDETHVREQIRVWEAAGVTTMLVSPGSVSEIERLADLVRE
jgi:alkanesulfonate monooxygenase SsuD/methylene tetrahydromethanopterin reductase-like flavin-dependent oxidoreductase (luciferase family)